MQTTLTPAEVAQEIIDIIELSEMADSAHPFWYQPSWFGYNQITNPDGLPVSEWLKRLAPDADKAACGTTACVAGWASLFTAPEGSTVRDYLIIYPDGSKHDSDFTGREALGLDCHEADWLFAAYRTRREVLAALRSIADGVGFDSSLIVDDDDEDEPSF